MATTTFLFPALRLKKSDVQALNFDRVCFQFSVNSNNVCTLIGYRMNERRGVKMRNGLIILRKDPDADEYGWEKISRKILWVQLELTAEELGPLLSGPFDYILFRPRKNEIEGYNYITYYVLRAASGGSGEIETAPCPPAIPPGGEG